MTEQIGSPRSHPKGSSGISPLPESPTAANSVSRFSRRIRPARSLRCLAMLAILLIASATGCGYQIGAPYQADIKTVHVPIFNTNSFRRGLEYQLTEAVQRRIQQRTPFRLAKGPHADTKLTGTISDLRKNVLGESAFDDARELQVALSITVTWEDLRSQQILKQQQIPVTPELVPLVATSDFAPEIGQSLGTSTQQAIDRLARQIVELMEMSW